MSVSPTERLRCELERDGKRPKITNGKGLALCPAHPDRNPSLSFTEGSDGRALVHCFAGCSVDAVLAAIGWQPSDLFRESQRRALTVPDARFVDAYTYHDAEGTVVMRVTRHLRADGSKTFRQQQPDGHGSWTQNAQGVEKPLYHLPRVIAARDSGQTVWILEGEKDADAVHWALGGKVVGTCNPGGADNGTGTKFTPSMADSLTGATKVVIVADKDPTGYRHARHVARQLSDKVARLVVAECPNGKDYSDHLANDGDPEKLTTLDDTDNPTGWIDESTDDADEPADEVDHPTRLVDVHTFLASPEPEYDWIIPDHIERGDREIITGPEGGGKSTLNRQRGVQYAAGIHPWTLEDIDPVRVALADFENSARQVRRALRPLVEQVGADRLSADRLKLIVDPQGIDFQRLEDVTRLGDELAEFSPDVLVIGPLYKMASGDPTSEEVASTVARRLDWLRTEIGCAVLIEAHTGHASNGARRRPTRPINSSVWLRWPEFGVHLGENGLLSHWRGQRDERYWPAALQRDGEFPWTVAEKRVQTWALIVDHCREAGEILSIRDLAARIDVSKSTIGRAVEANSAELERLRKTLAGEDE